MVGRFKDAIINDICGERISDNIYLDGNGQLICSNCVLARTGTYDYHESELIAGGSDEKVVKVYRDESEVFDTVSMKSMNFKPLVNDHPDENVTPDTVRDLQKGFMTNVRKGDGEFEGCLIGDLVVTDPEVIDLILNNQKRDLSVGYTADIDEENGRYVMKNIRGNHIALCAAGRAGNARIRDSKTVSDAPFSNHDKSGNKIVEILIHNGKKIAIYEKYGAFGFFENYDEQTGDPHRATAQGHGWDSPSQVKKHLGIKDGAFVFDNTLKFIVEPYKFPDIVSLINGKENRISGAGYKIKLDIEDKYQHRSAEVRLAFGTPGEWSVRYKYEDHYDLDAYGTGGLGGKTFNSKEKAIASGKNYVALDYKYSGLKDSDFVEDGERHAKLNSEYKRRYSPNSGFYKIQEYLEEVNAKLPEKVMISAESGSATLFNYGLASAGKVVGRDKYTNGDLASAKQAIDRLVSTWNRFKDSVMDFEAKGSFDTIAELRSYYPGASVESRGKEVIVRLQSGTKLLYTYLNGSDGKLLFIRRVLDSIRDGVEVLGDSHKLRVGQRVNYLGTPCVVTSIVPNIGSGEFLVEFGGGGQVCGRHSYDEVVTNINQGKIQLLDSVVFDSEAGEFKFESMDCDMSEDYSDSFKENYADCFSDAKEAYAVYFGGGTPYVCFANSESKARGWAERAEGDKSTRVVKLQRGSRDWDYLVGDPGSVPVADTAGEMKSFRVSVGDKKFDTRAHSAAEAMAKVRAAVKDGADEAKKLFIEFKNTTKHRNANMEYSGGTVYVDLYQGTNNRDLNDLSNTLKKIYENAGYQVKIGLHWRGGDSDCKVGQEGKKLEDADNLRSKSIEELREIAVSLGYDKNKLYGTSKDSIIITIQRLRQEGKKLGDAEPYVIFKQNGEWKGTPESNYNARIQNARLINTFKGMNYKEQVIEYLEKYMGGTNGVLFKDEKDAEDLYLAVNSVTEESETFSDLRVAKDWCNRQNNFSYVKNLKTGRREYGNI